MLGDPVEFINYGGVSKYSLHLFRDFPNVYGLQFIESGAMYLGADESERVVLQGQTMWSVQPNTHYRYGPASDGGSWSHRYVTFRGDRVEGYVREGFLPFAPQVVRPLDCYADRLDKLIEAARMQDRLRAWRATVLLEEILISLAEGRAALGRPPQWLAKVLQAIDEATDAGITIEYESIARAFKIPLPTLRRRFKALMGKPMHAYAMERRMERAMDMLKMDIPLKEIAYRLGYCDVCFFSRQFKAFMGVPPGSYRA